MDIVPVAASVRQYAEIVLEQSRRRELLRFADGLQESVRANGRSADDLWREAAQSAVAGAESAGRSCSPLGAACLDSVEAMPVRWLWPRRVPLGMPSIIFGPPGLGKSQLSLDVCARVTRGASWPDGGTAPLGNALILSAEDDAATVLRPRLETAGADLKRIFVVAPVDKYGGTERARST